MTPPPLLLDLDGTLVDTLDDICASANHLRETFGLPTVASDVARRWVGDGALKLMERALADLGPFEPLRARAWTTWSEHHEAQCTRLARPYPGVVECLERWRGEDRPLAVVTNKPERFTTRILTHLGLDAFLPVVVAGDTCEHKKPHPLPLRTALQRLGCPEGHGTMVGDGPQDVRAGRAAGMNTVAVLFGFHDEATLRAEGADEYWTAFGVAEKR